MRSGFYESSVRWGVDLLAYFFVQSYLVWIRHGREDKMHWALSKRVMFELKLFYRALYTNEQSSFPWKSIWRSRAPLRRSLLGMQLHGKSSHWKTSRKWQIIVINYCCMCKRDGKLITCKVVSTLYKVGVHKVVTIGVLESMIIPPCSLSNCTWQIGVLCWKVSLVATYCTFKNIEKNMEELKDVFFRSLYHLMAIVFSCLDLFFESL